MLSNGIIMNIHSEVDFLKWIHKILQKNLVPQNVRIYLLTLNHEINGFIDHFNLIRNLSI